LAINIRTGIGTDVHAFVCDRKLIIGGVHIPYDRGLAGHSDADVLVHSIIDAILGACGLGDIGSHFPDNDSSYKNADSLMLLKRISDLASTAGFRIEYIDSIIIAQKPRMSEYVDDMKRNIAESIGIDANDVSVKAKTTEFLGFVGREEGIAAVSIATVEKLKSDPRNKQKTEMHKSESSSDVIETANVFTHSPGSDIADSQLAPMLNNLDKMVCYTDGSSLGNPGPAGCSVVICDGTGEPLVSFKWNIGRNTNNIAEYTAILELLSWLDGLSLHQKDIEIRSDSELVIKQLSGMYKVKSELLRPVWLEASRLVAGFGTLKLVHVEREYNRLADKLAREASAKRKR
jgi:2-C-methyl-D-erythritol 2,4-cyclodiphosphate synthase